MNVSCTPYNHLCGVGFTSFGGYPLPLTSRVGCVAPWHGHNSLLGKAGATSRGSGLRVLLLIFALVCGAGSISRTSP